MGYVHTQLMPVVSHFYSSFFPLGRSWVNQLAVFTSLYYQSDCCFRGRGTYSTAEIGHTSDARMSTFSMYGSDSFRWQLSCQGRGEELNFCLIKSSHLFGSQVSSSAKLCSNTMKVTSTWKLYSWISCCRIVNFLRTSISLAALVLTWALPISSSVDAYRVCVQMNCSSLPL